jgi:hypothetical protein
MGLDSPFLNPHSQALHGYPLRRIIYHNYQRLHSAHYQGRYEAYFSQQQHY